MFSKRKMFEQILANKEAYEFLLNALAVGEIDSSIGIDKLAGLISDPVLKRKTLRLYGDEVKHGRLFSRRLKDFGLEPKAMDKRLDYETFLHDENFGLDNGRLDVNKPLEDEEIVLWLAGCLVREERACVELTGMKDCFEKDKKTYRLLSEIMNDEYRHVGYAMAGLQAYEKKGYKEKIRRLLTRYRRLEARVHAQVSVNFTKEFFRILNYPKWFLGLAIMAIWVEAFFRYLFPTPLVKEKEVRGKAPGEFLLLEEAVA